MRDLAIVNCRVSTAEQLQNNSLNRQKANVEMAAQKLDASIPADGIWSGSVSSKAGTNVTRKDLIEMLEYCKKHRAVKYAIFDEYDRFMRSGLEGAYWEVQFQQEGVKVWFASESDTFNGDDAMAKMMRQFEAFKAEGSNEERQKKSINGHIKAINEGRYTFPPKPGYMKGAEPGVHVPHPTEFKTMQQALVEIAEGLYTPQEALRRLNDSEFTKNHAPLRMDKFRAYATCPYYAGYVEIDKQVKAKALGRHTSMITPEKHEAILQVFARKTKRTVSKKQYNPEFPASKFLMHDCASGAKFTGSFQSNGHGGIYPKYRCRRCGKQFGRKVVHAAITSFLERIDYDNQQREEFIKAMVEVWDQRQLEQLNKLQFTQQEIERLQSVKSSLVREMASTTSVDMKSDLQTEIEAVKKQLAGLNDQLTVVEELQNDLIDFVKFGIEYTNALKQDWWLLDLDDRSRCQELLFPAGITFNAEQKVSTTELSPIYRFVTTKKASLPSRDALLVELRGLIPCPRANKSFFYRLSVSLGS